MSRLLKKPLIIPEGITVEKKDNYIIIKNSKGLFKYNINYVIININKNAITFSPKSYLDKKTKSILGTIQSLIKNAFYGLINGFEKKLEGSKINDMTRPRVVS